MWKHKERARLAVKRSQGDPSSVLSQDRAQLPHVCRLGWLHKLRYWCHPPWDLTGITGAVCKQSFPSLYLEDISKVLVVNAYAPVPQTVVSPHGATAPPSQTWMRIHKANHGYSFHLRDKPQNPFVVPQIQPRYLHHHLFEYFILCKLYPDLFVFLFSALLQWPANTYMVLRTATADVFSDCHESSPCQLF